MSLLLLWNAGIAVAPPAPIIVVVGGRPRRHPYRPKHKRIEAVVRELAEDLAWQLAPPPAQWEVEEQALIELVLLDALD